ncbi:MAG: hypothetical protein M3P85_14155 [Actinomycetota bacterium]|nr:hypothetical protein [Actinomycetota bacterium]
MSRRVTRVVNAARGHSSGAVGRELSKRVIEEAPAVMVVPKQVEKAAPESPHRRCRCPAGDPLGAESDSQSRHDLEDFDDAVVLFD